jgi:hypothetical protein
MLNQVFRSYRHESPEHAHAVRRLDELLQQSKIAMALDQLLLDDYPGGPDEGWPKWCKDRANDSACALIIASEGWFAAYNKHGDARKPTNLPAASIAKRLAMSGDRP